MNSKIRNILFVGSALVIIAGIATAGYLVIFDKELNFGSKEQPTVEQQAKRAEESLKQAQKIETQTKDLNSLTFESEHDFEVLSDVIDANLAYARTLE